MRERGYPVDDFETRAADLSVDHPDVVENYRAAHGIRTAHERGKATTDDLRKAVQHYRALFVELLEVGEPQETRDEQQAKADDGDLIGEEEDTHSRKVEPPRAQRRRRSGRAPTRHGDQQGGWTRESSSACWTTPTRSDTGRAGRSCRIAFVDDPREAVAAAD